MILTGLEGYLSAAGAGAFTAASTRKLRRMSTRFMIPSRCAVVRCQKLALPARANAMQAMRRILDGKEDDVAVRTGLAGMHGIGRHVNDRARFRFDVLTVDMSVKDTFENVDPLLIGMRMRLGAGARRHAHQADNHPLAFDTGAVCGRVI